jgi:hypothetical protein
MTPRLLRGVRCLSLAMLVCTAAAPTPARAWGSVGHEVVAELAAREIGPQARAMVEDLLGDRASQAMREHANWADEIRAIEGLGITAPFHYLNFPRGECRYVARRDCPGGRCIVGALERFSERLRDSSDREQRIEALKWVLHLVADIHQPLHAGFGDDRGGNDLQLRFEGEGTNLHALIDSGLLRQRRLGALDYADALQAEHPAPTAEATRWDTGAPVRWAEQSCELVASLYPPGKRIDRAYAERVRPLLEARLVLAAHRLARLLDALADEPAEPAGMAHTTTMVEARIHAAAGRATAGGGVD